MLLWEDWPCGCERWAWLKPEFPLFSAFTRNELCCVVFRWLVSQSIIASTNWIDLVCRLRLVHILNGCVVLKIWWICPLGFGYTIIFKASSLFLMAPRIGGAKELGKPFFEGEKEHKHIQMHMCIHKKSFARALLLFKYNWEYARQRMPRVKK